MSTEQKRIPTETLIETIATGGTIEKVREKGDGGSR